MLNFPPIQFLIHFFICYFMDCVENFWFVLLAFTKMFIMLCITSILRGMNVSFLKSTIFNFHYEIDLIIFSYSQ